MPRRAKRPRRISVEGSIDGCGRRFTMLDLVLWAFAIALTPWALAFLRWLVAGAGDRPCSRHPWELVEDERSHGGGGTKVPARARLMRPRPLGPRARNWLTASGVIGVCGSAELMLLPRRTALIVLEFTARAEFRAS